MQVFRGECKQFLGGGIRATESLFVDAGLKTAGSLSSRKMRHAEEERFCIRLSLVLVPAILVVGCNARRNQGALAADGPLPSTSHRSTGAEPPPGDVASTTASLDLAPEKGSSGCNLSVFGGTDRRAFDAFDARLRSAARSGDPNSFLDLVMYPLRVNRDRRSIMVLSREELASDAPRIFTASVRKDIEGQQGFFCRDIGLMYDAGTVWVGVVPAVGAQPERYAISTVNVPEIDPTRAP
jgi:hypothetical protein